uniref:Uncharacterized protein n=1 Tax=Rhizophora mucronata TaxID=61149 RepID=A0A2P2N454_RHIMU
MKYQKCLHHTWKLQLNKYMPIQKQEEIMS